jgi:hypothetical protein
MTRTVSSHDSADRAQFLKLFINMLPPALILLVGGEGVAYSRGWIGGWALLILVLLDGPLIFLLSYAMFHMMDRSATGLSNMVLAAGNLPPDPAHSAFESLTARGFYPEAVEAYRAHLAEKPGDNLARVKLADLYIRHLNDLEAAEQLYLDIRRGKPSPKEDRLASNLLIELYRKSGRRDRLMVELGRFAEQFKGTRAAEDAARTLHEMKEEMRKG